MKATPHRPATRRPRERRAFTLVEILVVVTIIALLASVVAWRVLGSLERSRVSTAEIKAKSIASALTNYIIDSGQSPSEDLDLEVLLLAPPDGGGPAGPYVNKKDDLLDPWENEYVLRVPGEVNHDFDIVSYGSDGQPGGEGDAADITH